MLAAVAAAMTQPITDKKARCGNVTLEDARRMRVQGRCSAQVVRHLEWHAKGNHHSWESPRS